MTEHFRSLSVNIPKIFEGSIILNIKNRGQDRLRRVNTQTRRRTNTHALTHTRTERERERERENYLL